MNSKYDPQYLNKECEKCGTHHYGECKEHPCKETLEALAAATATYNEKLKKFNEADRECALAYQAMSAALRQHNDAQTIYINKLIEERK